MIDNKESGCSASLGYRGPGYGAHSINLEGGSEDTGTCADRGVTLHEILQVMGVGHEQQRPDRDDYITINWKKLQVTLYLRQIHVLHTVLSLDQHGF